MTIMNWGSTSTVRQKNDGIIVVDLPKTAPRADDGDSSTAALRLWPTKGWQADGSKNAIKHPSVPTHPLQPSSD